MKRYGLIGYPLTHSFSQKFFSEKFLRDQFSDHVYDNFPIKDISELKQIINSHPDLCGLNVTIPYKKAVLEFLDEQSPAVQSMGACNCIKISHGKLSGYNTDVIGFEKSLRPFLKPDHSAALILGTGGAAAAVAFVFDQLNISYLFVSRTKGVNTINYQEIDQDIMDTHHLIVNTTPLGMYPGVEEHPPLPYEWMTSKHHCYDLIYNPAETSFLKKAAAHHATVQNGAEMLIIQAEESWRIWNE